MALSLLAKLRELPRAYAARKAEKRAREEAGADAHRRAVLQVVEQVAADAVRAGKATVEVKEATPDHQLPWIELRSTNPAACPVDVVADFHQIDLLLGHHGNLHELWEKDRAKRLDQLRECLEAVVSGRYEESVEERKYGRKFVGTFHAAQGPQTFIHYGGVDMDYGPLGRTTYVPYEGAD
jgi:hypothetical protein